MRIIRNPSHARCRPWLPTRPLPIAAVVVALASLGSCAGESTSTRGYSIDEATQPDPRPPARFSGPTGRRDPDRQEGKTHYVRIDGGDPRQCTGATDAAYPGSGTAQACAWSHPFHALPPDGRPRMDGGDTLIIGSGSYMMGPGAAGCADGARCRLPPVPAGPDAGSTTRVLGASCTSRPELWGSGGIASVISLEGSSNVEIGCLEITDHDDCVRGHSQEVANCRAEGAWARHGIAARRSTNVRLHDLDIHGLAATGINAGGLSDWSLERVRLLANGRAGWDGNVGPDSANSGAMVLRGVEIAWNGCGEHWKTRQPWACWAQQTGGYGDGMGTRTTGGQWLIEDAHVHHNTSDGLDLRYMDGASSTSVSIRRLQASANAGNQVKVRGRVTIDDSVVVGHCGFFEGKHFMTRRDLCRAGGNSVQLVLTPGASATIRNSTIAGEGGALIGAAEGDRSARVSLQDNVLVGFPAFHKDGVLADAYYANKAPAAVNWSGNLVWSVKDRACPSRSICRQHPRLADMSLPNFDPRPLAGSPVIGRRPIPGAHRSAATGADNQDWQEPRIETVKP